MEVALIPPGSLTPWNISRPYEMVIPEGIQRSSEYRSYYRIKSSKYTMLDNGAFESASVSDHRLLELAAMYHVDEVAAPDVIGDTYHSISRLENFLYTVEEYHNFRIRVMAIVQGKTLAECKMHITYIASTPRAGLTWTLGIPKHLVETTGHSDARLKLVRWTQREFNHLFQIHALGYNFPGEVQGLAELGVRSLDTSAPFIAAYKGFYLQGTEEPVGARPEDYWTASADKFDTNLLGANVASLDRWATV